MVAFIFLVLVCKGLWTVVALVQAHLISYSTHYLGLVIFFGRINVGPTHFTPPIGSNNQHNVYLGNTLKKLRYKVFSSNYIIYDMSSSDKL